MRDYTPSVQQKERRLKTRFQLSESKDAKVTFWTQQGSGNAQNKTPEPCLQGRLGNICEHGLQVILKSGYYEQLRPDQRVKLQLDFCSNGIEIKTEATGQLKYILPDEQIGRMRLGIEFLESDLDADTREAISQILEVVGHCPESKSDKCPNL
jgi:hypothetical protein